MPSAPRTQVSDHNVLSLYSHLSIGSEDYSGEDGALLYFRRESTLY